MANPLVIKAIEAAFGNAEDNAYRYKLSGQPSEKWEDERDRLRVALREAKEGRC